MSTPHSCYRLASEPYSKERSNVFQSKLFLIDGLMLRIFQSCLRKNGLDSIRLKTACLQAAHSYPLIQLTACWWRLKGNQRYTSRQIQFSSFSWRQFLWIGRKFGISTSAVWRFYRVASPMSNIVFVRNVLPKDCHKNRGRGSRYSYD